MSKTENSNLPVIAASARTPFLETAGLYSELMSYELGAMALKGVVEQSQLDPVMIEQVVMGTVVHETNTTNVARDAMLKAGLAATTPAYTVAMAGLSPNIGLMNICNEVALGRMSFGIASGTETFSDVPIRLSQTVRRTLMKMRQTKSATQRLKLLMSLRPRDLKFDLPSSSDFHTGLTMGEACEAMAERYGASREESDAFAANSHAKALKSQRDGFFDDQVLSVEINDQSITRDNSIRADSTPEKLAKLKPAFKSNGIITAGNSSRFTDGAGAILIGSMPEVERAGLKAQAIIKDYLTAGVPSLETEMLLGPAVTIPKLLARNGLSFDDIAVWELHEAFATQVLINVRAMQSRKFIDDYCGNECPSGELPLELLNKHGGSLALGNPFAATGIRLLQTAAQRMDSERQRYAIVSSCAGGGLGAAILLENPNLS
ncbi:MAG: thiolase family protein [Kangiellaceae bacterium]|jgi:acetyl-CoA acyltransferase|nr:thiolase family protein [Kangiellaceae bacterium]